MELHTQTVRDCGGYPHDRCYIPDRRVVNRVARLLLRHVERITLTEQRRLQSLALWIGVAADPIHNRGDGSPGNPDALTSIAAHRAGDLCFNLHPSVRFVRSAFLALTIWRANVHDEASPA